MQQICKELLHAKALRRAARSHLRAQKRTVQKQSRYRQNTDVNCGPKKLC
jgi:hypothetical protein